MCSMPDASCNAQREEKEEVVMHIIIKGKTKIGRTRFEQEENLRKEWGGTMTDEQLNKLRYAEKVIKEKTGSEDNFINLGDVDKVE